MSSPSKQKLSWPYRTSAVADGVVSAIQLVLGYFLLAVPLRLLCRARVVVDPNVYNVKKGTLFVANHQSALDPFIILAHIPLKTFYRLLPIRFPVKHEWISKFYLRWLYLFGGYDIGKNHRDKMLKLMFTRELVRRQVTVFLFPEGKVNKTGLVGELKAGIQFLITDSNEVVVVRMKGFHTRTLKGLLFEPRSLMYGNVVEEDLKKKTSGQKLWQVLNNSLPEF